MTAAAEARRRWAVLAAVTAFAGLASRRPRATRGKTVVLRDGSKVLVRRVQRSDAPLLADGFSRLSAESRRMRFLARKDQLSPAELRYLTDLDHYNHEALGALDHADGRGAGIARHVRDTTDPQAAEIAVTIIDDWGGRVSAPSSPTANRAPWSMRSRWRPRKRPAPAGLPAGLPDDAGRPAKRTSPPPR